MSIDTPALSLLFADGDALAWLLHVAQSLSVLLVLLGLALMASWFSLRYIPNNYVGIVEKLWSAKGSVPEGCIIAFNGEAGFQADLLRGGVHFGLWRWQYRIHKVRLVTVSHGKIGYVYARDGEPLPPSQTLGRVVDVQQFSRRPRVSWAKARSGQSDRIRGQRGRQRAILREGVYAINPALFVVITEDSVYALRNIQSPQEVQAIGHWQQDLRDVAAFSPVVIGGPMEVPDPFTPNKTLTVDSIGVVTVQDGPSLPQGEIIAPAVGNEADAANYHNNFQDTEAFLAAGGRRGRQYQTLTDGTYFINRWFAAVEMIPKTVVPIGYVGVVVSYYGAGRPRSFGRDIPPRRARGRRGARRLGASARARQIRLQHLRRQRSFSCRRPTSCCTGSPAAPRPIATTKACGRSTW